jgi:type IV pilus assembly protein PilM
MNFGGSILSLLKDPPPVMAFEISAAGIAMARLGPHTEFGFRPLKPGTITVSPIKDNVVDTSDLAETVRGVSGGAASRKRRDVAVILPDYCTRTAVLDFDSFPSDPKEQASLVRFRVKRSVPFDVESAALSYVPQPAGNKKYDVVVVLAPLEIVSRYEAPFRAAGMTPGFVTTSSMATLELVPEGGLTVVAKLTGHVLTVLVLEKSVLKLVRCLELPSTDLADVGGYLYPTFVYVEDNLGGRAEKLTLCGFGDKTEAAASRFQQELGIAVEPLRSPHGLPGENNAGLLGYLRSLARKN